jgi:hypothetical protein
VKKSATKKKNARRSASANPAAPPSIHMVFVDSNGMTTNGALIEILQEPERKRKLDHAAWNQEQTIRRFCRYLQSEDSAGLEAAVLALNRLDCWRSAVNQLMAGPSPNRMTGCALLSFWNTYGLYSVGRGLRGDLPHLVDAFRYLLPPYTGEGLTLCRGEVESRHAMGKYGISWTPVFEKAMQFAVRRWPDEGRGVVLKIEATPEMIVVAVKDHSEHTLNLGENEYIVDPRLIHGKVSVIYRTPDKDPGRRA